MDDDVQLERHLQASLVEALRSARVVNLIGPRQAGTTTLVRDLLEAGRFVTLDDDTVRHAIAADPFGQLHSLADAAGRAPVIIDEAHRLSELALALKRIVDVERRKG